MMRPLSLLSLYAASVAAELSIYSTASVTPTPTPTQPPGAAYTGFKAYDPTTIQPAPNPNPLPPLQFTIALPAGGMPGLSQPQQGNVLGVSIELSLAAAVLGPSGQYIHPQFLNLMAAFKKRGGPPIIRVGGNTQEKAVLVNSLPSGKSLEKSNTGATGVTDTPTVVFTYDILYVLGNISQILDIHWWLGVPMNETTDPRLLVAEAAENLFGSHVVGYQLGNEPDLFGIHGFRDVNYSMTDYFTDFTTMITAIDADNLLPTKKRFGAPSLCCIFTTQNVLDAGWTSQPWIPGHLNTLLVEQYPSANCPPQNADYVTQDFMNDYMRHGKAVEFAATFTNEIAAAAQLGVPIVLLETNTASCGGFLGLSDSFAAALWAADLGLQVASLNFTNAMLHVGGQDVYYNPFVPPPANQSSYDNWTVGPVWYSILLVAEALGTSGKSQVVDLHPNGGNNATGGYAIYENGVPTRAVLINYMTDPAGQGAVNYVATIQVAGITQAWVRTLSAPSTAWKGNITWGGQTYGGYYQTDGTLQGTEVTDNIQCPGGACPVTCPGPGMVVVFFSPEALTASGVGPNEAPTETFTTSVLSKTPHATLPAQLLASSNGRGGKQFPVFGSTSKGKVAGAGVRRADAVMGAAVTAVLGALAFGVWAARA